MTVPSMFPWALLALLDTRQCGALQMQRSADKFGGPRNSSEVWHDPPNSSEILHVPGNSSEMLHGPRNSSQMLHGPRNSSEIVLQETRGKYKRCTCGPFSFMKVRRAPQRSRRHKAILVTTSVFKAPELKATLKCNKDHVDRVIVLTEKYDNETIKVCHDEHIECRLSTAFHHSKEDAFNKGRAIRWVQEELHADPANQDTVILLVDADICLPENFWGEVPAHPKKGHLYSTVNRCMYEKPADYFRGWPAFQERYPLSTMGMFQMYMAHPQAQIYSDEYPTAAVSDIEFGTQFKKVHTLRLFLHHIGLSQLHSDWAGNVYDSYKWPLVVPSFAARCPCCEPVVFHEDGLFE